jgi:hypothetical protein
LTVENGLWRYYNNFNYCNCNAVDSLRGVVPSIKKLPTTNLDTTIHTIILLPLCSPYWLVLVEKEGILHKASSNYGKELWNITTVHMNGTIRIELRM